MTNMIFLLYNLSTCFNEWLIRFISKYSKPKDQSLFYMRNDNVITESTKGSESEISLML